MRPSFTSLVLSLAACLAGLSLAPALRAQGVAFWRSVTMPSPRTYVLPVQTYSGIAAPTHLFTQSGSFALDPATGTLGTLLPWNTLARVLVGSQVTLVPAGASANFLYITGQQNRLSEFSFATYDINLPQAVLPAGTVRTLFNSSTQTFVVLGNTLHTFNRATGTLTQAVANLSGVMRGAVGANDTIWLLTSNNGTAQVQSLSGDGSYTPGASFAVSSDAVSMAVSQWGTVYVSSQTGGVTTVTAYNASGQVLQTFASLSGDVVATGTPYLNVNSRGVIDLVDPVRNLYQQWFDPMAFGATLAIPAGTYSAAIGGSESIAAFITGTATLTGANTYSGNTVLANGTLVFGTASSLSPDTSLTFAGGTLQISPDFVPATGALRTTTAAAQDIRVDTNGQSTALIVNATGSSTLTKSGAGTLTLTGTSDYTGGTAIDGGTLRLSSNGALGAGTGTVSLNGGALQATASFTAARATTLGASGGSFDPVSGATLTWNGAISGAGPLRKLGLGELVLGGANTFVGASSVDAGTLRVTGSLSASEVTVNAGGTLTGTGTFGARATIASGGHLAPGNSPGTITYANGLTLASGSILDFELGTLSDLIRVSGGTLTGPGGTGGITLNLSNAGGFAAGTYTLFDFTGASTSSFGLSSFSLGTTISGFAYGLAFNGSTLELTSSVSAVPEPSTCAALCGAAALALAALRRRREGKGVAKGKRGVA